ncbi:MAG: hypothetical protein ABIM62_05930 [candidate division WOR-3 bacterium]
MSLLEKIKRENEKKKSILAKWLLPQEIKKKEDILIFEEGRGSFEMEFEKKETEEDEKEKYKKLILSFLNLKAYDEAIKIIEEMKEKGI